MGKHHKEQEAIKSAFKRLNGNGSEMQERWLSENTQDQPGRNSNGDDLQSLYANYSGLS